MTQAFEELFANLGHQKLVVMPISRLFFQEPFSIGKYYFFPYESDICDFLPRIQNKKSGDLRELASLLTGFDVDILRSNAVVVFTAEIDWNKFRAPINHNDDITLLKRLSCQAERALDMIRFLDCRFDLPDTLPSLAGSWQDSGQHLGALLYSGEDHKSYLISGAAVECSIVVRGLGLDVSYNHHLPLPEPSDGEVAAKLLHGLRLFSDALMAQNETMKFIRVMTLLDFLADPINSHSWEKQKGNIICHCAKDTGEYHKLSSRFKEIVSYRTGVIHLGKFLPDLIADETVRKKLFGELQKYASAILGDMVQLSEFSWEQYLSHRCDLKKKLGVS
jgi:hypothetical protein